MFPNYSKKELLCGKIIDDPFCSMKERLSAFAEVVDSDNIEKLGKRKSLKKIDLHLHSNYSDGFWTPCGIIYEACLLGLRNIALTDHDCFSGIYEAFRACELVQKNRGKEIIFTPGIELSTLYETKKGEYKEIHVLGYFPSKNINDFKSHISKIDSYSKVYLEAFQKCRKLRIYEMIKKFNEEIPFKIGGALFELSKLGVPISDNILQFGMRKSVSPGRLLTSTGIYQVYQICKETKTPSILNQNLKKSYCDQLVELMHKFDSPYEFMKSFFGDRCPSARVDYIGKTESPYWAIQTIRRMNGVPVLAHPILYPELVHELLEMLVPAGLKGIELVSSNASYQQQAKVYEMEHHIENMYPDITVTAGSDCHGHSFDNKFDYTPNNPMGLHKYHQHLIEKHYHRMINLLATAR